MSSVFYFISINYCTIQTQKYKFLGCKKLFQILPFYNTFIEKTEIKKLSNIKLLQELPFYDELSIVKSSNAFSGCTRS